MKPTAEQKYAIETEGRSIVVEAGAGTGKTWVLVRRFIYLLESNPDWSLDNIVAITFTEKAAREMRTRIRAAINAKVEDNPADSHWRRHLLHLDRLQVSTIHSLCARILRENSISAGIDPLFEVLDEQEADLLGLEAIRQTIRVLDETDHPSLELLASLRVYDLRAQLESMMAKRGTLQLLFADLEEPEELLDQWKSAIEDMRTAMWSSQLSANPVLIDIIESLPNMRIIDPDDRLADSVRLAREGCRQVAEGNLAEACENWRDISLRGGRQASWGGAIELAELKESLKILREIAKALESAGAFREVDHTDELAAQHLHLWKRLWDLLQSIYDELKDARQVLDFDDLELLADRLLSSSERSPRLLSFLGHIRHLMVDEFQDTNLIQQRIVSALAPIHDSGKLFLVGDAKQSIYRFRQAQVSIFNQVSEEIETATGYAPAPLSTSFRTHKSLVAALNFLFDSILSPHSHSPAAYEAVPGPLTSNREAHDDQGSPVEMALLPAKDAQENNISAEDGRIWEAQWIAERLHELKRTQYPVWDKNAGQYRPFEYKDAAVLFRATTNLPLYEEQFKEFGLPYLTVSGRGFYDRQEVQDLLALLAGLANPADDLNIAAALRSPLFSMSDETLYRLRRHHPDGSLSEDPLPFRKSLQEPPPTDQAEIVRRAGSIFAQLWKLADRMEVRSLLREILDMTGYEAVLALSDGATGRQFSNVQKFLSLAMEMGGISLANFLRRLRDLQVREAREGEALGREPESGAVQLMSIHAAKGLEFPVVVVADLGRMKGAGRRSPYLLSDPAFGLVCKVRDENGEWVDPASYCWGKWLDERMEEAENKRLLYVACTRAADLLVLSGKTGRSNTWLSEIMETWSVSDEGDESEIVKFRDFSIRVHRPVEPPDKSSLIPELTRESPPEFHQMPLLAKPLPGSRERISVPATRLNQFDGGITAENRIRPAIWRSQRSDQSQRAPGYIVGNIVHRTLAHWECLAYGDDELFNVIENYAQTEGVFPSALADTVHRVHAILTHLKNHEIYEDVSRSTRRYHEVPFNLKTPGGTVHGVIDLLYQGQDEGWHLLDWKTEWTRRNDIQETARQHLPQLSAYAHAVERMVGVQPDVRLCFLVPEVRVHRFAEWEVEKIESRENIK